MQKQIPKIVNIPIYSGNMAAWASNLLRELQKLFMFARNDIDNGAVTFPVADIAGIANASVSDFDEGQQRYYCDTSDSNKVYLVARVNDALKKVQLT